MGSKCLVDETNKTEVIMTIRKPRDIILYFIKIGVTCVQSKVNKKFLWVYLISIVSFITLKNQ